MTGVRADGTAPECGRPLPDPGLVGRVHGRGTGDDEGSSEVCARYQQPDAYMPAIEHAERFIVWITTDDEGCVFVQRHKQSTFFEYYRYWCVKANVVPLPEQTWQTVMKKHDRVAWKRDPRKCPATGRILRKPSGAPERDTYYTISPPRAQPALPGKVPVADIVPARAVETKSQRERTKQLAAAAAAQATEQPWQPLQRVA